LFDSILVTGYKPLSGLSVLWQTMLLGSLLFPTHKSTKEISREAVQSSNK
jgi:hypothetical protein